VILEVDNLHAAYGRIPILNGISFRADSGEAIGILGHNGMGKTTLLKTLVGQLPVTQGRIRFDGAEIGQLPSYRRARAGIGYVPQGRMIFPALSAYENLRMGYIPRGGESEEKTINDIRSRFPRLDSLLDRAGGALSGGEQQLLALARALCGRPKLLLLDEPTEGIQPSIVDDILEILNRLHRFDNLTIIVVEQSLDFISALSQRVLLIQKGTITRELSAAQLSASALADELGETVS
jgi:branched-chain amino acid transport system ATP-binding protein